MELILGIDLGTGGCKQTLIDINTGYVADHMVEYNSYNPHPGWSEQDPSDWLSAFYDCFTGLVTKSGINPKDIIACAIDGSTHNAVLLDDKDRVLRPCIMWNDQRSFAEVQWLQEHHGERLFQLTYQKASPTWTLPQLLWVKNNEPDIYSRIHRISFTKDHLRYLLTGVWGTEVVDAGGSMLMDFEKSAWSDEICSLIDMPLSALPPIGKPTDVVGVILPDIAKRLGLREDVKVVAGASDTAVEDYAAGVLRPGQAIVKLATAGNFNVFTEKPVPTNFAFAYNYVVPGMYYCVHGTNAAAASLRWFRDSVVRKSGSHLTFSDIERPAHEIPPGSNGVIYHPYLNGERTPYFDAHLRASFFGLSSFHDLRHMTRAVMEGVAYSLKDCMITAASVGLVPDEVRIIGGGGKSTLWCQIVADVLACPVIKLKNDDSSIGSAMLAGVGIGAFNSFADAITKCSEEEGRYTPIAENVATYKTMFGFYKEIHDTLADLHTRMYKAFH